MSEESKQCTKCELVKTLDNFTPTGKYLKSRCKKCEAARVNKYRLENYDLVKERKKIYWANNKHRLIGKHNEKSREYKRLNPEKRRETANKYARNNRQKAYEYRNNKYKTDPEFNIYIKIRARIGNSLRRINAGRNDRTIDLLGCDFAYFKVYVEGKFTDGMSIDKIFSGEIHMDHIIPCSKFDLTNLDEQRKCFHYTNLQPLWAEDNMAKHNNELWQKR